MYPANAYAIRTATAADEPALMRLAVLGHAAEISLPALIGEIDGIPAAAIDIADGRIVADPFACPPQLRTHLRMRADGIRAHRRTPSVGRRINVAIRKAA